MRSEIVADEFPGSDVLPRGAGIQTVGPGEHAFSFVPRAGEDVHKLVTRLSSVLLIRQAQPVLMILFGPIAARATVLSAMRSVFGEVTWPMLWVEGVCCQNIPIAGIQVTAVSGITPQFIRQEGTLVGAVYEQGGFRHCLLGGVLPSDKNASPSDQAAQVFQGMESALAGAGFDLSDLVRTWFYNRDLLSWYDVFNKVRNQVYSRVPFRLGAHPASTAVAGLNAEGMALIAGARAVQPVSANVSVCAVESPLQGSATSYGSAFSRAVELHGESGSRLLISGTASIAPEGQTLWVGNSQKQVEQTIRVVDAILESRGFTRRDLVRVTAYFRRKEDMPLFSQLGLERDWNASAVFVECDICRPDLLFEVEADAWKPA